MKYSFLFLLLLLVFISCVPNRKYVYLQHNDVNKKSLATDTLLRNYSQNNFDYKIQPEDIVSITFQSINPQEYDFLSRDPGMMTQSISFQANPLMIGELVDANGEVPFPVIGKVKVAGLSIYQAQDTLQQLANHYLQSPVVRVRLVNFRITILGEVNQEGTFNILNDRISILAAIGMAGGLTDLADKKNIKLIRQRKNKTEVQYIDLLDENFLNSSYYFANQNDILIVSSLRQRPYRKYMSQNISVLVSILTLIILTVNLSRN